MRSVHNVIRWVDDVQKMETAPDLSMCVGSHEFLGHLKASTMSDLDASQNSDKIAW